MARPKPQPVDITLLLRDAGNKLVQSVREPNILMYSPHHKQLCFHMSDYWGRDYSGGNRSGKTYAAVVEDIWWATGTHPYLETPLPPVRGRVVGTDFTDGIGKVLIPMFKRLLVPSMLFGDSWDIAYNKQERTLTFKNGSTIDFMSYDQEIEKFAGTSLHFIHYDEEPPKGVFDECQMRIADTEGRFWISMTPVNGLTWMYDTVYEPVILADDAEIIESAGNAYGQIVRSPSKEIIIIEVDAQENPYLSEKGRLRSISMLDEEDKKARSAGKFVEMSGLVFKAFDTKVHVIPLFTPPIDWEWYSATDHGWNNPTATLWSAVAPNGDVYTFSEHFAAGMTIEQHATVMHLRESVWNREPDMRVGDPSMKQTSGITGTSILQEYASRGIYISVESIPRSVDIGVERIQQYLKTNPVTGKPKWFITENCVNLIREMRRLRWKKYASKKMQGENNKSELIHKKDDHACDAMRYLFTCMPELTFADEIDDPSAPRALRSNEPRIDMDYGTALLRAISEGHSIPNDDEWNIYEGVDLEDLFN